jgi:two-component system nitrate/nitrite response regulator NarP
MTRVLIADDHPIMLSGLEAILLASDYRIVAKVTDGAAVLAILPESRPDILLMDVRMPERTGLDVLRTLRSRGDMRPVVLLTAQLQDAHLMEAIQLGVSGILLKDGAQAQLVSCLETVRAGGRWIERELLERALDLSVSGAAARTDPLGELAPKERAVVGLVAQGMRNRAIADELGLTEGTVKVYLHRIYEKLGVSSRTELAILARDNEAAANFR